MKKKVLISIVLIALLLVGCSNVEKTVNESSTESKPSVTEENGVNNTTEANDEESSVTTDEVHFVFEILDIFIIKNRGIVVTGIVKQGTIHVGDEVQISGITDDVTYTTVEGLETLDGLVEEVSEGVNIGILLGKEITEDSVRVGQVITLKDTIKTAQSFKACIYVYTEDEGNKNTVSFEAKNTEDIIFWSRMIKSDLILPNGSTALNPGETMLDVEFVLENPEVLEVGSAFSISENGCWIGVGRVTEIIY